MKQNNNNELIQRIKSSSDNHHLANLLLDQQDLSQLLQVNRYFMEEEFFLTFQQKDQYYPDFFMQTKQLILDDVLRGNRKAISLYLNLLLCYSQSVALNEDKLVMQDGSYNSLLQDGPAQVTKSVVGIVPATHLYDLLKIVCCSSQAITDYYASIMAMYADVYFYTVQFLYKYFNQFEKLQNYFILLTQTISMCIKIKENGEQLSYFFNQFDVIQVAANQVGELKKRFLEQFIILEELKQLNGEKLSKEKQILLQQKQTIINHSQKQFLTFKLNYLNFDGYNQIFSQLIEQIFTLMQNQDNETKLSQLQQIYLGYKDISEFIQSNMLQLLQNQLKSSKPYFQIIILNLILELCKKYNYSFTTFAEYLFALIQPTCFDFDVSHLLIQLLESFLLLDIETPIKVLFMKRLAQTALTAPQNTQTLIQGDYIYFENLTQIERKDYDKYVQILQEMQEQNELQNVALNELAILRNSTNQPVSQLLQQLYNGELENNFLQYQQLKKEGSISQYGLLLQSFQKPFATDASVKQNTQQYFFHGLHQQIIIKHLFPIETEKQNIFDDNSLKYMTIDQYLEEVAINKAGGEIMLKNVKNSVKVGVNLEIDQLIFKNLQYEADEVQSKAVVKENENISEADQREQLNESQQFVQKNIEEEEEEEEEMDQQDDESTAE